MNKTFLIEKCDKILRLVKNLSNNVKILKSRLELNTQQKNNMIKFFIDNLGELLSKITIFIYQMEKINIFLNNSLEENFKINCLLENVNLLDNKISSNFGFTKFTKK